MRVGVVTSLFPTAARPHEGLFAERRWSGFAARDHEVRVVQPLPHAPRWLCALPGAPERWDELRRAPEEEQRGAVDVTRPRYLHLPRAARGNAERFARAGVDALLDWRPEAVVADYAWPACRAVPALRARGIPCVVSGRGSDVFEVAGEGGLGDLLADGLRAAGHWIGVSRDLVAAMDELARTPGRGVLVPNGVDAELFAPRNRQAARAGLGMPEDAPLVLVVGHLIERKDPLLALDAFARGAPPDARLVVVGRGPLRDELARRAAAPGLAGRVELRGELPPAELAAWYAAADALLLCSKREGRPNVVLEALASGCAVVATDAGGTPELLTGAAARGLVRGRDAAALGRALAGVLANPPAPDELRALALPLSWDASLATLERCLHDAVESA
jgi:glycosyltransferase involved in cell wall biosynthesis